MTCKILVVDDEPEFCRLLASVLTEMGHEVSTASGGRQGLAKIRKNPPDILFLDIKMPRMNGLECLRRLRKSKRKPVIVVMTGYRGYPEREGGACVWGPRNTSPNRLTSMISNSL